MSINKILISGPSDTCYFSEAPWTRALYILFIGTGTRHHFFPTSDSDLVAMLSLTGSESAARCTDCLGDMLFPAFFALHFPQSALPPRFPATKRLTFQVPYFG